MTTNEAFKWEMVQDGIFRGEIWEVEDKQKFNMLGRGTGTGFFWKDEDVNADGAASDMKGARMVRDFAEVPNMYDRGLFKNLAEVLFPAKVWFGLFSFDVRSKIDDILSLYLKNQLDL